MDTEKTHGNGQEPPPEEKKPIIDQVTDLAAVPPAPLLRRP